MGVIGKRDQMLNGGWANRQYEKNLWTFYKLTMAEFNEIFRAQDGRCAGCKERLAHPVVKDMEFGLQGQVDHKHRLLADGTEAPCERQDVRGILCAPCNALLAKVRDKQEILRGLATYLQSYGDSLL